jgi:hypothetical protein
MFITKEGEKGARKRIAQPNVPQTEKRKPHAPESPHPHVHQTRNQSCQAQAVSTTMMPKPVKPYTNQTARVKNKKN